MPKRLLAPQDAPARVESFTDAGATLVAEDFGDGTHPIVLLHGIGMGRSVYIDFVERLTGRVIGIDLAGFGEAPEPEHPLTMQQHADLVAAYLRMRGISDAVIVGHSMGSQIGAEVAARHPDVTAALVLAGPTVNSAKRTIAAQAGYLLLDLIGERPLVLWRGAREYLRGGPHLIQKMRATITHHPERAYPHIGVPVLVLRGADDPLAPADWCERIVGAVADGRFVELPGHGHATMISRAADAADAVIEFTAGLR